MTAPPRVIGWKLDPGERAALLERFPPGYQRVIADHVTLESNAAASPLPPDVDGAIVGRTDDEASLEALVVTIDGSVDRPDGSTFHITWSLGPGRRAKESNDVLKARGWTKFEQPIPLRLVPARF